MELTAGMACARVYDSCGPLLLQSTCGQRAGFSTFSSEKTPLPPQNLGAKPVPNPERTGVEPLDNMEETNRSTLNFSLRSSWFSGLGVGAASRFRCIVRDTVCQMKRTRQINAPRSAAIISRVVRKLANQLNLRLLCTKEDGLLLG